MSAKIVITTSLVLLASLNCFARGGTVGSAGVGETLKPSAIRVTEGTGVQFKGIYKENLRSSDPDRLYVLTGVEEELRYNEKVITYEDVTPGVYQYRFQKIDKRHVQMSPYLPQGGCAYDHVQVGFEQLKSLVEKKTENLQVLSKTGALTATLRLQAAPPVKSYGVMPVITIGCDWPATGQAPIEIKWALAKRPSSDWKEITVKTANKLQFVVPSDVYGSEFELRKKQ